MRRRALLGATASLALPAGPARAQEALRLGLTPVFSSSDVVLLRLLEGYLGRATGLPVETVKRRTYQEITLMLLTGQLDAAWICGFPYVQYRPQLALVAVPVYRGAPLYQSYLIANRRRGLVADLADLEGGIHAFSDPDSNSGWLVTAALLRERGHQPASFFAHTIFTYGHRNVVRAVGSGLADSGSVDGYVFDVLAAVEPALGAGLAVVRRSELLGFPPIACRDVDREQPRVQALARALLEMTDAPGGSPVLAALRLDGFTAGSDALFDGIADKAALVATDTGGRA